MSIPSQRARVAVIGARIGQAHIKGYLQVPEAEIAGICDLNLERAQLVAREANLPNVPLYTDYRKMLDELQLDAVSISLPNMLHEPVATACLQAGVHVLCEKPLALNAAEGQRIADVAAAAGKFCMVGQVLRFRAESLAIKAAITRGELGSIYYTHAGSLRKRGIPGLGGWFTTKELSGGGSLIDLGVHLLDLAWWLNGCPRPIAASGVAYAEFGPRGRGQGPGGTAPPEGATFNVEDLAVAMIRFEGGLTINLEASWALNARRDNEMWVQLYGTEGGAEWGEQPGIFGEVDGQPTIQDLDLPKTDAWKGEIEHFVHSVLNNTPPDPDVTQGVTMMKMLDAIYASATLGHEVLID